MKNKISRELIIEKTLELIKLNDGSTNVNLRKIAKELGCNHTNIYNYFNNREDLLLHGMACLIDNIRKSGMNSEYINTPKEIIINYTQYIIEFAVENSGWYKFIWLETFDKNDLEKFLEGSIRPEFIMKEPLKAVLPNLDDKKIEQILILLHGYIHGEISKFICGRSIFNSVVELKEIIIKNTEFLLVNLC